MRSEFAGRTCQICQAWLFDDETGEIKTDRRGLKIRRPPHLPPLCRRSGQRKCPKGTPETETGFDAETYAIYQLVKRCEIAGQFPNDPLLLEYAKTVRLAEDEARRQKEESATRFQSYLVKVATRRRTET